MKYIITEQQLDSIIEKNLKIILDLIQRSSLSKHPFYNRVRIKYDGERIIVRMYVNSNDLTDELQDYLDDVYNFVSRWSIKPVYVEWEPVQ